MDTQSFFIYPSDEPVRPAAATTGGFLASHGVADWDKLLAHCETLRFKPGEVVLREKEVDEALYVLGDGRLEVLRDGASARDPLTAPAIFGELEFLDGLPRTTTLRALTHGEAHRLGMPGFEALTARDPRLARDVLAELGRLLAGRLRRGDAA